MLIADMVHRLQAFKVWDFFVTTRYVIGMWSQVEIVIFLEPTLILHI